MNDNRNPDRRMLLKGAALGGAAALAIALPSRWTRPIVEAVILPAHAAASLVATTTSEPTTTFNCACS